MTASTSGLYGNFGQANYAAAKSALVGLSNTLAIEGHKYGIFCNVVVPYALSRLTENIFPEDIGDKFAPKHVAPLVAWLCHENCESTGQIYAAGGGWYGRFKLMLSQGKTLTDGRETTTPEAVASNWEQIGCLEDADVLDSGDEAMGNVLQKLEQFSQVEPEGCGRMDPKLCKGYQLESAKFDYTANDAILYALGVGAGTGTDLRYIYEGHPDFTVLPTFVIRSMFLNMDQLVTNQVPGVNFDLTRVLHGEEYIEVLRPLDPSAKLRAETRITDLLDKGSGAALLMSTDVLDGDELIARLQSVTFLVGMGGFGGPRKSDQEILAIPPPKRTPDAVRCQSVDKNQAALYRLGGADPNPIHVDPDFASMAGFANPILHGMCTLGFSVRHVLQEYAGNDATFFKALKCRFSKPVVPGDTLETQMWREGNRIHFITKIQETGSVVVSNAYVDLVQVKQSVGERSRL